MFDDYVSANTTPLYANKLGSTKVSNLLWGDGVRYVNDLGGGSRMQVTARGGRRGWVERNHLNGQSLLEMYFAAAGSGDGILIKTPMFRHIMIDGGFPRSYQDAGQSFADFVDWKFYKDYGQNTIELDVMLASDCNAKHYGGLWDLLNVAKKAELDAASVSVDHFCHAGLSWWKGSNGKTLGKLATSGGNRYWVELLGDRNHAQSVVGHAAGRRLHGWWHDFVAAVLQTNDRLGHPTRVERLSFQHGKGSRFVPGFAEDSVDGTTVRVLGPVEYNLDDTPGIKFLGSGDAISANGVSLVLRIDYGSARILLVGDLDKRSQRALMEGHVGQWLEFQCDVARVCQHDSQDISYRFFRAMRPGATILASTGDFRSDTIVASATYGQLQLDEAADELITPLVYSLQTVYDVNLGSPKKLEIRDSAGNVLDTFSGAALNRARLEVTGPTPSVRLGHARVVTGQNFGMVSVRTDGDRILCATLNESGTWNVNTFRARF